MSSELHRFGIDDEGPPDKRWKRAVNALFRAIINNPHHLISNSNSRIVFPEEKPPGKGGPAAVTSTPRGAFYRQYTDDDGHTWLQGGQVKSGSGNFTIADKKVIDAGTGPVEAAGDILVLEVTVNGYVADGVLLAGLTATAADYITPSVSTVDSDTMPTVSNHTGLKVRIEIGRWTDSAFLPAESGNIRIAFCPGAYQITRY